ncbi:hypothetical protein EJ05DRAFT_296055 [Pseudovirgaria hyperparasitica]|uniref:Uncharacterized protein n=1 Tax=Pseudovirgaria hyperparasitica TaxID=470096 RepID=A0A6A6VPL7_9PEZI|nr:uncharacterized protein EJ05DRAFT_296055 [Pseudovirgaria hyperparasitica]KAF2752562.1 hypothetical protein EJ05DRAFT_296055 [Pseudovirgaria hyperparasitica]
MSSGPYRPTNWALGGANVKHVDIPITAVFLVLFILGAATHMTIFQLNRRRGHKFIFSVLLFGFCMSRIATTTLRIASTSLPTNLNLSIAASIFVAAGVLLIFIVNLLFTQRVVRAMHPTWGWHKGFKIFLVSNYVLIVLSLVMVITATVQSFFTLSTNTRRIDRDIQMYGQSFFMLFSFYPIPLLTIALLLPRKQRTDKFGSGRFRTKIAILYASSILACLGASYRAATSYLTPVSQREPLPDYFHKVAFYLVNFGIEIIIVYMFAILRIDLRFHVPNGARGSYAVKTEEETFGDTAQEESKDPIMNDANAMDHAQLV